MQEQCLDAVCYFEISRVHRIDGGTGGKIVVTRDRQGFELVTRMQRHKIAPIIGGSLMNFACGKLIDGRPIERSDVMDRLAVAATDVFSVIHTSVAR